MTPRPIRNKAITTLKDLTDKKAISEGDNEIPLENLYFKTEIGLIKLNSIDFTVVKDKTKRGITINYDDVARAVIEDVITNHEQYLHDDGSIKEQAKI